MSMWFYFQSDFNDTYIDSHNEVMHNNTRMNKAQIKTHAYIHIIS